jgi:hypothetical protein
VDNEFLEFCESDEWNKQEQRRSVILVHIYHVVVPCLLDFHLVDVESSRSRALAIRRDRSFAQFRAGGNNLLMHCFIAQSNQFQHLPRLPEVAVSVSAPMCSRIQHVGSCLPEFPAVLDRLAV